MLSKVFKHDFRAIGKKTLPLMTVMGMLAVLNTVLMTVLLYGLEGHSSRGAALAKGLLGTLLGFSFVALVALYVVAYVLMFSRYYKSTFTDEGYLTLTLPVGTHSLLGGKFLAAGVWVLIDSAVLLASVFVTLIPALLFLGGVVQEPDETYWIWEFFSQINIGDVALTLLKVFFSAVANIMVIFVAITLGSLLMNQHKILGSVLFFVVVNAVCEMVESVIGSVTVSLAVYHQDVYYVVSSLVTLVMYAGLSVGMYFLNHYMLRYRMNLQ